MGPVLEFTTELDRMIQLWTNLADGHLQDVTVGMLQRIKKRDYGSIAPFRRDLQEYAAALDERNKSLQDFSSLMVIWHEGMAMLRDKYWRKYLFNPETDLAQYA
jgi:hypothetical protein